MSWRMPIHPNIQAKRFPYLVEGYAYLVPYVESE
jgi:hypothetical protein